MHDDTFNNPNFNICCDIHWKLDYDGWINPGRSPIPELNQALIFVNSEHTCTCTCTINLKYYMINQQHRVLHKTPIILSVLIQSQTTYIQNVVQTCMYLSIMFKFNMNQGLLAFCNVDHPEMILLLAKSHVHVAAMCQFSLFTSWFKLSKLF